MGSTTTITSLDQLTDVNNEDFADVFESNMDVIFQYSERDIVGALNSKDIDVVLNIRTSLCEKVKQLFPELSNRKFINRKAPHLAIQDIIIMANSILKKSTVSEIERVFSTKLSNDMESESLDMDGSQETVDHQQSIMETTPSYSELNHQPGTDVDTEVDTAWPCSSCKLLSANVSKILDILVPLQQEVQAIRSSSDKTTGALILLTEQYDRVCEENKALGSKIDEMSRKLLDIQTSTKKTLMVGDSLLRDINPPDLVNAELKVLPNSKVSDVLQHLQDDESESFGRIVLTAGTNNCSSTDFNCEETAGTFKNVIDLAIQKVPTSKDVCVMSIPPRVDSDKYQQNVDLLNACLCTVAQDSGATFINNDSTFRLSDGTPNDGYLTSDGLHLNEKGISRLIKNAKIKIQSKAKGKNAYTKKRVQVKPSHINDDHSRSFTNQRQSSGSNDDNGWQTVTRNRRQTNHRDHKRHSSTKRMESVNDTHHRCWFCYESNHTSKSCRWGGPVTCHTCGNTGHKKKFCSPAEY